ncbi:MAG: hypothetical protein AAF801_18235 [Pseudomonadota bacterium]
MSAALISIAAQIGAPIVRDILKRKIGSQNAELAETVITAIADRAGVGVEVLDDFAQTEPQIVSAAIEEVERASPEMIALYERGLEHQFALLQAETKKSTFYSFWRPLWMYLLAFLWLYALVLLHVANAVFKIALPPPDLTILLGVTSLFLALYMGGHTLKQTFGKVITK